MEVVKLALEVLYIWLLLYIFIGLMAYGIYLFLELWETDRENLLILMAVSTGGVITGVITGIIMAMI